jgi:hypothetical protein
MESEVGEACNTNGERSGVYRILWGNLRERYNLEDPRWKDSIKIYLRDVGCGMEGGVESTDLVHDTDRWRSIVNAVMNLWIPQMRGI